MLRIFRFIAAFSLAAPLVSAAQQPVVWRFDSLTQIGGNKVTTLGSPKLVQTDLGAAIHFTGTATDGDALFFDTAPLTGTVPYTWEAIFRPASGGMQAQRFFHLQETGSQSRRMFELRIVDNKWCLDSFGTTAPQGATPRSAVILKCDAGHLFSLDQWHAIAATYDGKTLRSYVDGVLQGEADVTLDPLGTGGTSVGTRYNKRDFFTGDVLSARFTKKVLPISDLLKVPVAGAIRR